MWFFKDKDLAKKFNKVEMASAIGLNADTLRRVINGKQGCSKMLAYCITKYIDDESKIEDYFSKIITRDD